MIVNNYQPSYNNLSFESSKFQLQLPHYILNKVGELTPQKYNKMSRLDKFILRKFTPLRLKELAMTTCDIADKVKTKFDNLFGENNYMVIAVGRSIASVAETLGFMGNESKIIPLSELSTYLPKNIQDKDIYKQFLDKIGLTKELIRNNPKKKFVLMDYVLTGDSLATAKEFLEQPEFLGKSENFISREINSVIRSGRVLNLFYLERFKNFSPIGKLPLDKLKDVFQQADSTTSNEGRFNICQFARKLFLFNILDSLTRDDYYNFYPTKEVEAIERFESEAYLERKYQRDLHLLKKCIHDIEKRSELT